MELPLQENTVLEARISTLEEKLKILESYVNFHASMYEKYKAQALESKSDKLRIDDQLEFQIGSNWFAKFGLLVIGVALLFILFFPYAGVNPVIPDSIAYVTVFAIMFILKLKSDWFGSLSNYILGGCILMLYIITLYMGHNTNHVHIHSQALEFILLTAVSTLGFVNSFRLNSKVLMIISLSLGYFTAIIEPDPMLRFLLVTGLNVLQFMIFKKYNWLSLFIISVNLSFICHFLWFLNNPQLGNDFLLQSAPESNLLFLLINSVIFASTLLLRRDKEENPELIVTSLNYLTGTFVLFMMISLLKFNATSFVWQMLLTLSYFYVAIIYWVKERSTYVTFFAAILAYLSLSTAILSAVPQPHSFIFLAWQSLLVISTALWFRSQIIVSANFFIFLLIFIVYMVVQGNVASVSLSFGIVALLSARIMNFQKNRLQLQTEMMRNAYLGSAFFILPWAMYHIVSPAWVIVSWISIALLYFGLSRLLSNVKYRWMGIGTMMVTVIYIFIIGIQNPDPFLRIASFLILGLSLLGISVMYNKNIYKSNDSHTEDTGK